MQGRAFLTDPLLLPSVGPLRRRTAVPPLPDFHTVSPTLLISHGDYDHLHLSSLRRIPNDLQIYAPPDVADFLQKKGFSRSEGIIPGESVSFPDGSKVEALPADHKVRRKGFQDAIGFLVSEGDKRVYFAGDTDLFPEMKDLDDLLLAMLPISGWGRNLGPGHMNPERAAEAVDILRPRHVVPIHWGTLRPFAMPRSWSVDRDADGEFFRALYRLGLDSHLQILKPGQFLFFGEEKDPSSGDIP